MSELCNAYHDYGGAAISPCHKPSGHDGDHEGWCLGSRCIWADPPLERCACCGQMCNLASGCECINQNKFYEVDRID